MKNIAVYITNNFTINSGSTVFFTNLLECFNKLNHKIYVFTRYKIPTECNNLTIISLTGENEKSELAQIFDNDKKYDFYKIFVRNNKIIELLPLYHNNKYFREKILFWFWSDSNNYSKNFNYINRYNLYLTNSELNIKKLDYFKNLKVFMPLLDDINYSIITKNNKKINLVYFGCFKKDYLIENLIKTYIKEKLYKFFNLDCFLVLKKSLKYKSPGLRLLYNLSHDELVKNLKTKYYDFSFNIRENNFAEAYDPSSKLLESVQYNIKPIVNKNQINEELLGVSYPFYFDNITEMIKFLKNYKHTIYNFDKNSINKYLKSTNVKVLKNIFD